MEMKVAKMAESRLVNQIQMPRFGVLLNRPSKNIGAETATNITHSIKIISR
jgi:hypothetical protein